MYAAQVDLAFLNGKVLCKVYDASQGASLGMGRIWVVGLFAMTNVAIMSGAAPVEVCLSRPQNDTVHRSGCR